MNVRWRWLAFALFTAVGLLLFSYHYFDDLARNITGTALSRFVEEMTGAYAALALLRLFRWIGKHFPWQRNTWPRTLFANLIGAVVYSTLKTTLMALSRTIIFPLVGLGHYDYGNMIYRYPMEFSNDLISYTIIAGAIYTFARLEGARASEVHAAELQTKLAQSKLENLRLQLHPHFLFNTLNAISSVMYEDVGKADAMLAKLSEFLRLILASSDVPEVSLEEELIVETMYVEIMKARLESALELTLSIAPEARTARVPNLLLQPILENSIRHGMAGESRLSLTIEATRHDGTVRIRVRDNGAGLAGAPRFGHGLSNVESRLAHLYGDDGTIALTGGEGGGAVVTIALPYRVA